MMSMSGKQSIEATPSLRAIELAKHLQLCVPNSSGATFHRWPYGNSVITLPELQIIEAKVTLAAFEAHLYLTAGASDILDRPGYGIEFCFLAKERSPLHIELLAMVSHMHADPDHRLNVGHTMNLGRPVLPGSPLDHLLISLPYLLGQEFEFAHFGDGHHAQILWVVPITENEQRFRHESGLDALEDRFEEAAIDVLDAFRPSVT